MNTWNNFITILAIIGAVMTFGFICKEFEDRLTMIETRQDQLYIMAAEAYPKESFSAYKNISPKAKMEK